MPKTLSEVAQDATALPESERLKLARMLLDLSEVLPGPSEAAEAAWGEEITRRLDELRNGKVQAVPLTQVRQRIEAGFAS